jgi:hypothetical protein
VEEESDFVDQNPEKCQRGLFPSASGSERSAGSHYRKFDDMTGQAESAGSPSMAEWLKQLTCARNLRFKSQARLEAENLVLRPQLNVLIRELPKRVPQHAVC